MVLSEVGGRVKHFCGKPEERSFEAYFEGLLVILFISTWNGRRRAQRWARLGSCLEGACNRWVRQTHLANQSP